MCGEDDYHWCNHNDTPFIIDFHFHTWNKDYIPLSRITNVPSEGPVKSTMNIDGAWTVASTIGAMSQDINRPSVYHPARCPISIHVAKDYLYKDSRKPVPTIADGRCISQRAMMQWQSSLYECCWQLTRDGNSIKSLSRTMGGLIRSY